MKNDVYNYLNSKPKWFLVDKLMSVICLLGSTNDSNEMSAYTEGWYQSRQTLAEIAELTKLVQSYNEDKKR